MPATFFMGLAVLNKLTHFQHSVVQEIEKLKIWDFNFFYRFDFGFDKQKRGAKRGRDFLNARDTKRPNKNLQSLFHSHSELFMSSFQVADCQFFKTEETSYFAHKSVVIQRFMGFVFEKGSGKGAKILDFGHTKSLIFCVVK